MITMEGKYQTRDGRPVRILCVDKTGLYPVVGIIGRNDDVSDWTIDGDFSRHSKGSNHDLIQVPEPPKYIPYTDADRDLVRGKWIKSKHSGTEFLVESFGCGNARSWTWVVLFDDFTFLDGSTFGKLA